MTYIPRKGWENFATYMKAAGFMCLEQEGYESCIKTNTQCSTLYDSLEEMVFYIGTEEQKYEIKVPPQGYLIERDFYESSAKIYSCETAF